MSGETLGRVPTSSLPGMLIRGMIEFISLLAPQRELEEYDVVDNQLFMIVHLDC